MTTALSQPPELRTVALPKPRNMIAIASGKGGVGKTWLAITLTHALSQMGRRALLFDGDLGLANVDIQLGLMPEHDLGGVLAGRLSLAHATVPYAAGGFDIVAGRSGCGRLAAVPPSRIALLGEELVLTAGRYDHVILDLGAGIERTVRQLTRLAGSCIVVTTDEPTSLTDAYAFIKLAQLEQVQVDVRIIVNMASSQREGEKTFGALFRACASFLQLSPQLLGIVRRDVKVRESIRYQTPLLTRFPNADAATDVKNIAASIASLPS
ncbi:MAG: MinD/ParA family protein [Rhodospirillales bacterium]|nr:MinD/ParA family protein [Rhodospirillales bacterium]